MKQTLLLYLKDVSDFNLSNVGRERCERIKTIVARKETQVCSCMNKTRIIGSRKLKVPVNTSLVFDKIVSKLK